MLGKQLVKLPEICEFDSILFDMVFSNRLHFLVMSNKVKATKVDKVGQKGELFGCRSIEKMGILIEIQSDV